MGDIIGLYDYDFPRLISGDIIGSLIGQYISDLLFNIFVYDRKNFYDIITKISPTPAYMAATTSGFLNGITEPYIDDISSIAFRNVAYVLSNDYYSRLVNETDVIEQLDFTQIVQDTLAVVIIAWAFNKTMRNSFYNQRLKKNGCEPYYDEGFDGFSSAMIIILTNLYAYYKFRLKNAVNQIDFSIDLSE